MKLLTVYCYPSYIEILFDGLTCNTRGYFRIAWYFSEPRRDEKKHEQLLTKNCTAFAPHWGHPYLTPCSPPHFSISTPLSRVRPHEICVGSGLSESAKYSAWDHETHLNKKKNIALLIIRTRKDADPVDLEFELQPEHIPGNFLRGDIKVSILQSMWKTLLSEIKKFSQLLHLYFYHQVL